MCLILSILIGSASSDDAENVVPVPPVGDSEQPAAEDKTQTEEEPLQLGNEQVLFQDSKSRGGGGGLNKS